MFRHLFSAAAVTALGLAGMLVTAGTAAAQQGWQFYGGAGQPGYSAPAAAGYTYYGGYGSSEYTLNYSYGAPTFPAPAYAGPGSYAPSYSYGSPSSTAQASSYYDSTAADGAAVIDVRVPANALILFDRRKTTSAGPERHFISPPLTPGKEYVYEVSARWQEGGREVTRTRSLVVRAGERLQAAFGTETPR